MQQGVDQRTATEKGGAPFQRGDEIALKLKPGIQKGETVFFCEKRVEDKQVLFRLSKSGSKGLGKHQRPEGVFRVNKALKAPQGTHWDVEVSPIAS